MVHFKPPRKGELGSVFFRASGGGGVLAGKQRSTKYPRLGRRGGGGDLRPMRAWQAPPGVGNMALSEKGLQNTQGGTAFLRSGFPN
jgi:hypothetical protein